MSVNGPISPKQCYYGMDYSFYSFYCLASLEIRLDHNSTYYRSLSKTPMSSLVFHIAIPKTSNIRRTPRFDILTDEYSKRVSIIRRAYIRDKTVLTSSHSKGNIFVGPATGRPISKECPYSSTISFPAQEYGWTAIKYLPTWFLLSLYCTIHKLKLTWLQQWIVFVY